MGDDSGLLLELSFALIITVMLFNISRIVAIRYGDAKITHITLRPYYISLGLLCAMFLENFYYLMAINVIYKDDWSAYFKSFKTRNIILFFSELVSLAKFALILIFVIARTFEHEILVYFIRYQGRLKLQNLEVERERY